MSNEAFCSSFSSDSEIPLLFPVVQAVYSLIDVFEHCWFGLYSMAQKQQNLPIEMT